MACTGCGAEVNSNVQPLVILADSTFGATALRFCDYDCVATYAAAQQPKLLAQRQDHMDATVRQLNETVATARQIEGGAYAFSGEYATVESVPLHPLTELCPDGVVRLKGA